MRYSKRKSLTLAAGLACLSAALLIAHEPQAKPQAASTYQHIEQQDIYLVMSDQEQLKHARHAVHQQLVRPLLPNLKMSKFSRAMPVYNPDFRPVFAQAQNGTVPFSLYKHTGTLKRPEEQKKTLFLVGYYDVTQGTVMVFDSRQRGFIAANQPDLDLKRIGFHLDPQQQTGKAKSLVKFQPETETATQ